MNQILYEKLIMLEYLGQILLARVNSLYFISIKIHRHNEDAYLVLITTESSISTHMLNTSHNWDLKKIKGHSLKCLYFVLSFIGILGHPFPSYII